MTTDGLGRPVRPARPRPKPGKPFDPVAYANRSGSEHAAQTALFGWAAMPDVQIKYPELQWMFAIPNGGLRDKITASNLKAEGVKEGVSDIFLPVPRGSWAGLFIEMKRPKSARGRAGVTKSSQEKFIEAMVALGYGGYIAKSFEEARDVIIAYLEWKT